MTDDQGVLAVVDRPPGAEPKLTVVVGLSLLVGVLLTVIAAGGVLYDQRNRAEQAQLRAAGEELKAKEIALAALNAQIELLSGQMHALKEHSIARSTPAADYKRPIASAPPVAAPPGRGEIASPVASAESPLVVVAPKAKKVKAKPTGQDCELVGKSAQEQAETLQRCVAAMDSPKAKSRSR